MKELSLADVRRLAVQRQCLAGQQPTHPSKEDILHVAQAIRCIQLDPINVVARNPLLIFWSRLGNYQLADFETLLWQDKKLIEYWAHAASLVLVEDFPIHHYHMHHYHTPPLTKRRAQFLALIAKNDSFKQYILQELRHRGPLFHTELEDRVVVPFKGGWTGSTTRNRVEMLDYLWTTGQVTIVRRDGNGFGLKKKWGLLDEHLPQWANHDVWSAHQVSRQAVQHALLGLGAGTAVHIRNHFTRNRYPHLAEVLEELVTEGIIKQVSVNGEEGWYIHKKSLPLLDTPFEPDTRLLSPFDNLICDRDRTEAVWGFYYRSEIYTPKAKRKYGYYVMPILHGSELIGRLDPRMDRKSKTLHIQGIYLEDDIVPTPELKHAVEQPIQQLAQFLGAKQVSYSGTRPDGWSLD